MEESWAQKVRSKYLPGKKENVDPQEDNEERNTLKAQPFARYICVCERVYVSVYVKECMSLYVCMREVVYVLACV